MNFARAKVNFATIDGGGIDIGRAGGPRLWPGIVTRNATASIDDPGARSLAEIVD